MELGRRQGEDREDGEVSCFISPRDKDRVNCIFNVCGRILLRKGPWSIVKDSMAYFIKIRCEDGQYNHEEVGTGRTYRTYLLDASAMGVIGGVLEEIKYKELGIMV